MATPALDVTQQSQVIPPQPQRSQEHTADAPMVGTAQDPQNSGGISEEDQQRLIGIVRRYKDQWSQSRLIQIQEAVENLEFFKGNQNITFGPGNSQFINTTDWIGSVSAHSPDADDDDIYQDCLNFYQMLAIGFVAALCPQVPKSKWMPEDADQLTDVATAKAAQTLVDVVERDNKEASLLKSQLLNLYCTGTVFRHTRYVVSADLAGTKTQPVFDETETTIMPARKHCFNCGTDNQPQSPACQNPNCGKPMGDDSFFPEVIGPVTKQVGTREEAKGIVAQTLYSKLEVDVDPTAETIRETPILNLEYEVHLAALRAAYPDMYEQIQASATSELSSNGSIDRIARQQIYSPTDGQISTLTDQKPTISKSWIQDWAFDLEDDKAFGERMREAFPTGCLLINTGPTFLFASEANMNKQWTVAKTHEGFGMNPPTPGSTVLPFQRRYNDMGNILHEGIERGFGGILLSNNDLIDNKSFQGKPILPGTLNGVKLKRTGAPGSMKLEDALYQVKIELEIEAAMEYQKQLALNAQTFAGVPPQVYGGKGDPNVQTASGQEQQLETALGALNIYWENLKDEHAAADQLAVECAADNMTEDIRMVIEDKGSEYRNDYVRLDDLQGSVQAYADTDQGLPVTAADLRARWMTLLQAAAGNEVVQAIFDDPENQEQCADAIGTPGMVVPGGDMRSKTLQIIEQLLKAEPIPQTDPQTGQQTGQVMPSIMPDEDMDDFGVEKKTIKRYCQKNYDIANTNPNGYQNIRAYYKQCTAFETAQNIQAAQASGATKGAELQAGAPPPKPPPQLSPQEQSMLAQVRADGAKAIEDLVEIAGTPKLGQGESLQAQVAAGNAVMQLAAKVEQIAADKTAPQGQ